MNIETDEINMPSFWATYLVNNDASGLEEGEQEKIDQWLERRLYSKGWHVCCPEGESFFGTFEGIGHDLLAYPIYREIK